MVRYSLNLFLLLVISVYAAVRILVALSAVDAERADYIVVLGCSGIAVERKREVEGMAVRRVREYLDISHVFSAGDSLFDIPMLNEADVSFVPWGLEESLINNGCLYRSEKGELFSDFLLEKLYKML